MFIGEKELKLEENSYENRNLLLLLPPDKANTIIENENVKNKIKDFFSNKEKSNFVQICSIKSNLMGRKEIVCDYKFVK